VVGAEATYPELPWPHLIAGQAALAKGDAKAAVASLTAFLGHQSLRSQRALQPGRGLQALARRLRPTNGSAPNATASASNYGCNVVVHQIRSSQNGAMVLPQLVVDVAVPWYKMACASRT
jgi:hypothetical protein